MKKLIASIIILITLFSCFNKANEKSVHEEFVKKYFEYFNAHNWQAMANMYIDSADFKDPSLGKTMVKQTRQETASKYKALAEVFPNIHDEIINIYPSNEKHIVVEFVSSGTSADGKSFTLPICTIFTFENNKITKDFTYFDNSQ
jgi:ketosteroid isomerase-like protein